MGKCDSTQCGTLRCREREPSTPSVACPWFDPSDPAFDELRSSEKQRSTLFSVLLTWKDRKAVATDLRPIYEAPTAEEAAHQLDAFGEKWAGNRRYASAKYPSIAPA